MRSAPSRSRRRTSGHGGRGRKKFEKQRKLRPATRILLYAGGIVAAAALVLWVAGVRVLPDDRYSWEMQARNLKVCNDRLETLLHSLPSPEEREALTNEWSEVVPSPEATAWIQEVQATFAEIQEILGYTMDTKYKLSASRLDLEEQIERGTALTKKLYKSLHPEADWNALRMRAWMRSFAER